MREIQNPCVSLLVEKGEEGSHITGTAGMKEADERAELCWGEHVCTWGTEPFLFILS